MIDQQIPRNARNPGPERPVRRAVTRQRPINAQKYFLREVLGFLPLAREAIAQVVNPPRMAPHKLLPGSTVAPDALLYQLSVWLQMVSASQPAAVFALTTWNVNGREKVPQASISNALFEWPASYLRQQRRTSLSGDVKIPTLPPTEWGLQARNFFGFTGLKYPDGLVCPRSFAIALGRFPPISLEDRMRKAFLGLTLSAMILLAITFAGCGGSYQYMGGPIIVSPQTANVSFTVGDDPPAGVAILRFQTEITDATLQPQNSSQPAVSMLLSPLNVELLHLQTETAPLGNISVPTGTYTSLTASFANPVMTIFNNTAQTLTMGAQSCATNQICVFNPPLDQTSATVQAPTAPFPVTLSADSPLGFEMHFDVNASVQGDLTVSPVITLKQIIPPTATSPITQFHVIGRVSSVSSPDFTLQTGFGGLSLPIVTNSSTTYNFGPVCAANDFACIADAQVLRVEVNLLPDGTFVATHVRLLEKQSFNSLQGLVVRVNAAQNSFDMILLDLQESFTSVIPGLVITVQTNSSTTFSVDSDGITVPSGLTFTGISSFVPGQTVEIHPMATPVVTPGPTALPLINVSTDSVTLESTEISGIIGSMDAGGNPLDFTMVSLSPLFAHASVSLIDVDTVTADTQYINVSGLTGLGAGDKISVGGLLFSTATSPTIVAERIRLH
jgi:hypothetical protein